MKKILSVSSLKYHHVYLCRVLLIVMSVLFIQPLSSAPINTSHPFMLWTKKEAAAIRHRINTEPWAKKSYEELLMDKGWGQTTRNLFSYLVMGDQKAGETEKKILLGFIGKPVDSRTWSDNYLIAVRYDVLYDLLTPQERQKLEATFRDHLNWQFANDKHSYTKTSWLPNMQWCRSFGIYLMSVALKDEALIRKCFNGNGGWKYYFDDYVSDGYFYNEEFGKQYSMIGEMLIWCRSLERMGLNDLGYGYTGKGGATMKRYLESYFRLGYPRVDQGSERPAYPRFTIGDAKGGNSVDPQNVNTYAHNTIAGFNADGMGGNRLFSGNNMNGRDYRDQIIEKFQEPLWFEIAYVKWPDAGFDYFLAQMRKPGDNMYYPTPYFSCPPIDPAKVKPLAAPSWVAPERGVAMMRAEESPAYWSSSSPAVGVRMGTRYVHEVSDRFCIAGMYAFNKPILVNRGCAPGYAGTDPGWSNSIRSHNAVMVDAQEPGYDEYAEINQDFSGPAKFFSMRSTKLYRDVDMTRSLVLTNEYLLDINHLSSPYARSYIWMAHTLGNSCPDNPKNWAPTRHLVGTLFDCANEKSLTTDQTWSVSTTRAKPLEPGVRITMLGSMSTTAYTAVEPVVAVEKDRFNFGSEESGGAGIYAERSVASTTFTALIEPFSGVHRIRNFRQILQIPNGAAVMVTGTGIDDRILYCHDDSTRSYTANNEYFSFSGRLFVRISPERVDAWGKNIESLRVCAKGTPVLFINGKDTGVRGAGGFVVFGKIGSSISGSVDTVPLQSGPLSARWQPDLLRIPTGGRASATIKLHNYGLTAASVKVKLLAPEGITLNPSTFDVMNLLPGTDKTLLIEASANAAFTGIEGIIRITTNNDIPFQDTRLTVTQGMVSSSALFWPRDFARTIYSPRYVVKYTYLSNVGAALLLDPMGRRRSDIRQALPHIKIQGTNPTWKEMKWVGYQAFDPVRRKEKDGTNILVDMGQHPHGYRSPFEYRFTEDWILARYKDANGQLISMDWSANPGFLDALAFTSGGVSEVVKIRPGTEVRAIFSRSGLPYGEATFYPAGSRLEVIKNNKGSDIIITQPGDMATAFTYCTEAEFADFVKKWLAIGQLADIKPHAQGDPEYNKSNK